MRKVKETTWDFTVKKEDAEGDIFDTVTKTIDGAYPENEVLKSIQVDGWVITTMTLTDTNYE